MRYFSVFVFIRKGVRKKKRIDRSSIPTDCMRKMTVKEAYICYGSIYPSILNCGYRKDRIISDKKAKHFWIQKSVSKEFNGFRINERKKGTALGS